MTTEVGQMPEVSEEELKETATELFEKALHVVKENENFKAALVRKFVTNPQGRGVNYKSGQVEFESNGTDFKINLDRDVTSDRVSIGTESEGVEEHISLSLTFKTIPMLSESRLGGVERGGLDKVILAYRETNWYGNKPSDQYVNTGIAIEKIRQFLQQI